MTRAVRLAGAVALVAAALVAAPVRAETITVGVYAPAAPFRGTPARVDFATRLAKRVAGALGADGIGRVYGKAGDFAAAVRRGDVQLAVVDAAYLAGAGGNFELLAIGVRDGATEAPWQLVGRGRVSRVLDLRGKSLLVPAVGGRESDFVLNAMFGGELSRDFFSRIEAAPDALSAVAAVGLGKADAAVVPGGIDLPTGVTRVATLMQISGPVLVAYASLPDRQHGKAAAAATAFKSEDVISGFRAVEGEPVRRLARRFSAPSRRGPMAIPNIRIAAGELIEGRRFVIDHADARRFAVAPPRPPSAEEPEDPKPTTRR
jgi:hypothetical protein